jgi:hypothetical protein
LEMNYQQKYNLETSKIEDMRKRAITIGDKKMLAWCDIQLKMRKPK